MKLHQNGNYLPAAMGVAALAGAWLRASLYAMAMDDRGLLTKGHPLEWTLWALTVLALGKAALTVRKLDGSERYEDNFAPSALALAGHVLAAAAIGVTVVLNESPKEGVFGLLWRYVGLASVPCLIVAGLDRIRGRKPYFLLHLVPGCFYALHLVNMFQTWSGNPQTMDYVFQLLAVILLSFFCVYTAYLEVGLGRRRMQLFTGLAACYLAAVSAAAGDHGLLYAGSAVLALSNLATMDPKSKPPREEEAAADETA